MVFRKVLKHNFLGALKSESAVHECCLWWVSPTDLPKEKQQVCILSAAPSPPAPHIGNYRTNKVHRLWVTHQGYVNVHSWSLHKSIWNSAMPKEHKYICKRSEASILDATSQFEGLNAIVSKGWIDEVQIRRWYHLPEHSSTLLGTLLHKRSSMIRRNSCPSLVSTWSGSMARWWRVRKLSMLCSWRWGVTRSF